MAENRARRQDALGGAKGVQLQLQRAAFTGSAKKPAWTVTAIPLGWHSGSRQGIQQSRAFIGLVEIRPK